MAPGAVNVPGSDFEKGHSTVVNGLREDFNGFLINGVSNKGLSGGVINTPIQDTVQEFQQLGLNNSAEYGSSAGSITNLVSKSGTNSWHGSGWDFMRHDKLDANDFFLNQQDVPKQLLRFNQWGATLAGIVKNKLFFFISYQDDHFKSTAPPTTTLVELPEFRQAVITALPNWLRRCFSRTSRLRSPAITAALFRCGSEGKSYRGRFGGRGICRVGRGIAGRQSISLQQHCALSAANANLWEPVPRQRSIRGPHYQASDKDRLFIQYNWLRNSDTLDLAPQLAPVASPTRPTIFIPMGSLVGFTPLARGLSMSCVQVTPVFCRQLGRTCGVCRKSPSTMAMQASVPITAIPSFLKNMNIVTATLFRLTGLA